jgi:5-methyltetrahydropteroyltriglutamate--homocysteine methyltransferase
LAIVRFDEVIKFVNMLRIDEDSREKILYAANILGAEKIYVNPDCGLRTRSRDVAISK